jgi:hypothetical protein
MHTGRNVTIDPLAPAPVVEAPEITHVLSLRTGRLLDAKRFISRHNYEELIRVRTRVLDAMNAGRPRLVCSLCHVPVYIVASTRKAFFFRHRHEDGSCPAVTRNFETEAEIRARQYAGVQESEAHRRLKRLLARSISADPNFSELAQETTWRATTGIAALRRPDVSCAFGGLKLAFEAQLSTTFLSVVVGRRAFYRAEGALLVWALASFDPNDRRMTEDDILFPNNSNVLVVDEASAAASEKEGRFMVTCWHRAAGENGRQTEWAKALVGFDELTLDVDGQRAFLVDVEGEERRRREAMEAERARRAAEREEALRSGFLSCWLRRYDPDVSYPEREREWLTFVQPFAERGLPFPPHCWGEPELDRRLKAALTAKAGIPVGWRYKKLPEVAHHLHDRHPDLLFLFGRLLKRYRTDERLKAEDKTGAWSRKAAQVREEVRRGSRRYQPAVAWAELLAFLFPEAADLFSPASLSQASVPKMNAAPAAATT